MNEDLRIRCLKLLEEVEDLLLQRKELVKACNVLSYRREKAEIKVMNVKYEIETSNDKEIFKQKYDYLKKRFEENSENLKSDIRRKWDIYAYFECDYEEVSDETLKMKLFDAQESYRKAQNKTFNKQFQIEVIDRKVYELREKVKLLKTHKNFMDVSRTCTCPICYNVGFYKGNNPAVRLPKEQANYSVDLCLECDRKRGKYRERNQKNDPSWYNPNYATVEYKDGQAFKEVKQYFDEICLQYIEKEVVELVKKRFKN